MSQREHFGSRIGFILAAVGSAVGLGNIWRFPFVAGENGGGAFVVIYFSLVLLIGLPVMLTELLIGRHTQRSAVGALERLGGPAWKPLGLSGVVGGFILLSFYGAIGGITLRYTIMALLGRLHMDAAAAGQAFELFTRSPLQLVLYQLLFMAATVLIVSRGIGQGIERFCKVSMPLLFVLLLMLVLRSVTLPGAGAGLSFYLQPDFASVSWNTVLAALSQAFFSLSLGIGAVLVYGSYLDRQTPLAGSALQIGVLDTLVAFVAGLVIFPAVFAFGFEPGAGPGLTFVTLPAVFSQMPLGGLFAVLFFGLLAIASLTSSVNMLEIVCAYFVDERAWSRRRAALILGCGIFLLGVPSAISLGGELSIAGRSFMDCMDFIVSSLIMPLGGMSYALFAGWRLKEIGRSELGLSRPLFTLWLWVCRIVAPIAIFLIFINGLKW